MSLAEVCFKYRICCSVCCADVTDVDLNSDREDRIYSLDETVYGSDKVFNNCSEVAVSKHIAEVSEDFKNALNGSIENFVNSAEECCKNIVKCAAVVACNVSFILSLVVEILNTEDFKERDNCIVVTVAAAYVYTVKD